MQFSLKLLSFINVIKNILYSIKTKYKIYRIENLYDKLIKYNFLIMRTENNNFSKYGYI